MKPNAYKGQKWVCLREGGHLKLIPWDEYCGGGRGTHSVQQDTIEPFVSPLNGEVFDSRSRYERHVKQHGHRIVGNDWQSQRYHPSEERRAGRRAEITAQILETRERLGAGQQPKSYMPQSEAEKLAPIRYLGNR